MPSVQGNCRASLGRAGEGTYPTWALLEVRVSSVLVGQRPWKIGDRRKFPSFE
jgi:hypothetical protein